MLIRPRHARPHLFDNVRRRALILVVLALSAASPALQAQCTVPCTLIWEDEFNGSEVDATKWQAQIGTGPPFPGWGNAELQYYRAENATVAGGNLTIAAKQESFGGQPYTSARLRTRGLADFTYGRFEMRAKLPYSPPTPGGALTTRGLWPAFWLLHSNANTYGIWAASGEIDVMEWEGRKPDEIFGTIHYGGSSPDNRFISSKQFITGSEGDFHVYAIEWDETEIRWYLDGELYGTKDANQWFSGGPDPDPLNSPPAPFDIPFHMILNLAVGGNLPGPPDGNTVFPAEFVVDYVRVYELPPAPEKQPRLVVEDNNDGDPFFDCSLQGPEGLCFINPYLNASKKWRRLGNSTLSASTDVPPQDGGGYSLGFAGSGTNFYGGAYMLYPIDISGYESFSFWVDPAPGETYTLEILLQDDDNGDGFYTSSLDDEFKFNCEVSPTGPCVVAGGGWQLITVPLADFEDRSAGGNGIMDTIPVADGGNGQLVAPLILARGSGVGTATFNT
ncbi:MAG: glycoside hydrolase family 16 protein, partial [Gammaproteobacteria bacterium]|nr:glycoside hydrolase family 16 protein [Gammaproteobacteria bacterium]